MFHTQKDQLSRKIEQLEAVNKKYSKAGNMMVYAVQYYLRVPLNTSCGTKNVGMFITIPEEFPRKGSITIKFNVECSHSKVIDCIYMPSWQGSIKERTLQQIIEALEFDCKVESLKIRKTPKAGPDIPPDYKKKINELEKETKQLKSANEELTSDLAAKELSIANLAMNLQRERAHNKLSDAEHKFEILVERLQKYLPEASCQELCTFLAPELIYTEIEEMSIRGNNTIHFYKEKNSENDADLAIKMFPLDKEGQKMAKDEFKTMLKCYDPRYTVSPFQLAYNNGSVAISMEYGGVSLNEFWINWELSFDSILYIFLQLARGLKSIHQNNVYHGDIKPQNILVKNEELFLYSDFGGSIENKSLIYRQTQKVNGTGALREFTFPYLAPEVSYLIEHEQPIPHDIDLSMLDVYSLSLTIYSLVKRSLLTEKDTTNKNTKDSMIYGIFMKDVKQTMRRAFMNFKDFEQEKILFDSIVSGLELDPKKRINLTQLINILVLSKN